jgi:hypothetical protein
MWFGHTVFLHRPLLGRRLGWSGQARDDHSVPWGDAARSSGRTRCSAGAASRARLHGAGRDPLCAVHRGRAALSIPLAVDHLVASVGRMLMRAGIGALPEENAPPAALRQLALPAIEAAALRAPERVRGAPHAARRLRSLRIYYGGGTIAPRWTGSTPVREAGRSGVRCRLACRRPHRGVPRLGARVVACEPNPPLVKTLRLIYGRDAT